MIDRGDRVLLTGLTGFIAKHVAFRLLQEGYRVRATVRDRQKGEAARRTLEGAGADVSRLEIVEADLLRDSGWDEAMQDVRFVQHTASPFPGTPPRDKFALVPTARDGTLRVVEAAKRQDVERVVLTSSVVAIYHGHEDRADKRFTESDFTNVESDRTSSYAVSKTLAERAAWEAIEGSRTQLAVLNPALVLGPALDREIGTSLSIIEMMMRGRMPMVPNARFGIVDVRDVAEAHLRAMTKAEAAGRRFILSGGHLDLMGIGKAVGRIEHAPKVLPFATIPDWVVRAGGRVSRRISMLTNELDRERTLDASAARSVLGLAFRSPAEAAKAAAESLRRVGVVG